MRIDDLVSESSQRSEEKVTDVEIEGQKRRLIYERKKNPFSGPINSQVRSLRDVGEFACVRLTNSASINWPKTSQDSEETTLSTTVGT